MNLVLVNFKCYVICNCACQFLQRMYNIVVQCSMYLKKFTIQMASISKSNISLHLDHACNPLTHMRTHRLGRDFQIKRHHINLLTSSCSKDSPVGRTVRISKGNELRHVEHLADGSLRHYKAILE